MNKKLYPIIFLILLILFIELTLIFLNTPSFLIPRPTAVFNSMIEIFPIIKSDLLTTLIEALLGFAIALMFSLLIAYFIVKYEVVEYTLMPIFVAMQSIPTMLLAPIFVIWFGYGMLPKVILVFLICFFPILISLIQGIKNIDKDYVKLLKVNDASYLEIYINVYLQGSLKSLFGGMKVALSYSVIGAVFGEMMGGSSGIGLVILRYQTSYQTSKVFAIIAIIMIISFTLYKIIDLLERKIINYEK